MKKFISLLLCTCLCLSLFAGCGGDKDSIADAVPTPTPAPQQENTPTPEPTTEPTPEPTPEAEDKNVSAGIVDGGVYTNATFGVSCDLGEDWMFFDEAQLAEVNGLTAELFDDEELQQQLANSGLVYDMYAMRLDGGATINIIIEDLGLLYGALLSEEDYVDVSINSLPDALASAGFADLQIEKTRIDFCGKEHAAIILSGSLDDMAIYETLVCVKAGKYMAAITIASYVTNTNNDILACFSAAE